MARKAYYHVTRQALVSSNGVAVEQIGRRLMRAEGVEPTALLVIEPESGAIRMTLYHDFDPPGGRYTLRSILEGIGRRVARGGEEEG